MVQSASWKSYDNETVKEAIIHAMLIGLDKIKSIKFKYGNAKFETPVIMYAYNGNGIAMGLSFIWAFEAGGTCLRVIITPTSYLNTTI